MKVTRLFFLIFIVILSTSVIAQFKVGFDLTNSTCFNTVMDGDETGIDCGGSCPPCPSCSDGIQNQGEIDIDCGGPCQACQTGGSSSRSSGVPIKLQNLTIEFEILTEEESTFIEENASFEIQNNEGIEIYIDLSNFKNITQVVNLSTENLPDFLEIDFESLIISPDGHSRIILKTNPEQYQNGNYSTILLLTSGKYEKKINLYFEIKEEDIPLSDIPLLMKGKNNLLIYFLILIAIVSIIFFIKRKKSSKK